MLEYDPTVWWLLSFVLIWTSAFILAFFVAFARYPTPVQRGMRPGRSSRAMRDALAFLKVEIAASLLAFALSLVACTIVLFLGIIVLATLALVGLVRQPVEPMGSWFIGTALAIHLAAQILAVRSSWRISLGRGAGVEHW